jgi:hypothetical protein
VNIYIVVTLCCVDDLCLFLQVLSLESSQADLGIIERVYDDIFRGNRERKVEGLLVVHETVYW